MAAGSIDSARQNLASTFVNALMNVGFGTDKLMLTEGNKWLYKNKEHGMMSATASLGAILLWDVDGGLTQIDKFLYSTDNNIKAGALLSVGLLSCGTRNECDPALALLTEYASGTHPPSVQMSALFGLGLAYAGSKKEEVLEALMPVVENSELDSEVIAMASLSLGLTCAGSCNAEVAQALMTVLMERPQRDLQKDSMTRLVCCLITLAVLVSVAAYSPAAGARRAALPPGAAVRSGSGTRLVPLEPAAVAANADHPLTLGLREFNAAFNASAAFSAINVTGRCAPPEEHLVSAAPIEGLCGDS